MTTSQKILVTISQNVKPHDVKKVVSLLHDFFGASQKVEGAGYSQVFEKSAFDTQGFVDGAASMLQSAPITGNWTLIVQPSVPVTGYANMPHLGILRAPT